MSKIITLPYEPNLPVFVVPCEVCAQEFTIPPFLFSEYEPDVAVVDRVELRIVDRWDMPDCENPWGRIYARMYQGVCKKCGTMYQTWDHKFYVPPDLRMEDGE